MHLRSARLSAESRRSPAASRASASPRSSPAFQRAEGERLALLPTATYGRLRTRRDDRSGTDGRGAGALIDRERPLEAGRIDDHVEDAGVLADIRRVGPGAAMIDDLREWTAADGAVEGQPQRAVAG